MATLQKIRNHGVVLLLIVGAAMLAFILGDAINSGSSFFNLKNRKVAVIEGNNIMPEEYQAMIDETTKLMEIQYNQSSFDEEMTVQIREQVWQQLLMENLLNSQADKIGLAVTDEEIDDFFAQNGQNMRPEFRESNVFRRMIYVENLQRKYTTLVQSLIRPNSLDAEFAYEARTNFANTQYVMAPYAAIADSTVEVSESDIKKLYNERKHAFKQKANREIAYVIFADDPSKTDFADTEAAIKGVEEAFKTNGVDTLEHIKSSIDPKTGLIYEENEYTEATVPAQYKEFAFAAGVQAGASTDLALVDGTYSLARVTKCNYFTPDSIRLSIKLVGDTTTPAQVQWVRMDEMPQFIKDSIAKTPVGQFFVLQNQGQEVAYTVDSTTTPTRKVTLAVLRGEVLPSSKTHNANYNIAKQFAVNNKTEEDFRASAEKDGLTIIPQPSLLATTHNVGQLKQSREVVRWAFQQDKEGVVSDVFECGNNFVVAVLVEIHDGEYASLDQVEPQLRAELIKRQKAAQLKEQLSGKSLAEAAKIANTQVANADSVSLGDYMFATVGVEPAVLGTALAQEVNKVSAPVEGNQGVFVIKTTAKGKKATGKFDAKQEMQTLLQRYSYAAYQALNILEQKADITDNRGNFQ